MKFLALLILTTLLPLGLATKALAEPTTEFEPASTEAQQIQPLPSQSTEDSGIAAQEETLEESAEQINHNLNGRLTRGPQLRDLLNLPDGMIIRGSSRGGLGIGTEY
jgi:hypothetical protein